MTSNNTPSRDLFVTEDESGLWVVCEQTSRGNYVVVRSGFCDADEAHRYISELLCEEMTMNTNNTPTAPGHYYREIDGEIEIVRVCMGTELYYKTHWGMSIEWVEDDGKWRGPVPSPEEVNVMHDLISHLRICASCSEMDVEHCNTGNALWRFYMDGPYEETL